MSPIISYSRVPLQSNTANFKICNNRPHVTMRGGGSKLYICRQCNVCNISFRFDLYLQWRHNGRNGVSNHRRSKKTSKSPVAGFCERNPPVDSPHKRPVTRKMITFHHVIIWHVSSLTALCLWRNEVTKCSILVQLHISIRLCSSWK